MISFLIKATNSTGHTATAVFESLDSASYVADGFSFLIQGAFPTPVTVIPPAGTHIVSLTYTISTPLKNYHQVIIPDTGRSYSSETQLVSFWGRTFQSRINSIRMPVFILTGQNQKAQFVFGIIGHNYETDFAVREPAMKRALLAFMKRFSLEIKRGVDGYPIPDSVARANADNSITEYIYFKECATGDRSWIGALRDFSQTMAKQLGKQPKTTDESLEPYWCSWTDWDSAEVTETVILDNVKAGIALGIKNFIIDDGWFGPGLDSDFGSKLNIGDWNADPKKIPDMRKLVRHIHSLDGRAIIWCAPHAVSPDATCCNDRRHLFIQNKPGKPVLTSNGYHPLCFMCPEAREIMAEICAGFITRYDVDGAKYDLFNNIPSEPCVSTEHRHDTSSLIQGLDRTMARIHQKTTDLKPGFITELKQNYGTPWLYEYGTVIRAGDTPYNPEGNFLRTAYVNAYTPYSCNDYQTISNSDSPEDGRLIIIKMLSVGVPTYSMDLASLSPEHAQSLRFYHQWYCARLANLRSFRVPVGDNLDCWKTPGNNPVYFLLNSRRDIDLTEASDCEIVNGTMCSQLLLTVPRPARISVRHSGPGYGPTPWISFDIASCARIDCPPGSILSVKLSAPRCIRLL